MRKSIILFFVASLLVGNAICMEKKEVPSSLCDDVSYEIFDFLDDHTRLFHLRAEGTKLDALVKTYLSQQNRVPLRVRFSEQFCFNINTDFEKGIDKLKELIQKRLLIISYSHVFIADSTEAYGNLKCIVYVIEVLGKNLVGLHFFESHIIDSNLVTLSKLENLQELSLNGCFAINDNGLLGLGGCTKLKMLDLSGCSYLTGRCFEWISKLGQLETLYLDGCGKIKEKFFSAFSSCKNLLKLKKLDLSGCSRLNYNFFHFFSNADLEELFLRGSSKTTLNSCIYEGIAGISKLKTLDLTCAFVDNKSLRKLVNLPNLKKLNLYGCRAIGRKALETLAKFKSLQWVDLGGCRQVTDYDIAMLQTKRPDIKIVQ